MDEGAHMSPRLGHSKHNIRPTHASTTDATARTGRANEAAPLGLSHGHNTPYLLRIALGAQWTSLERHAVKAKDAPKLGKRGSIRTFSKKSQSRLRQTLAQVQREPKATLPLFVTMTYHQPPVDGGARIYSDMEALWKRLRRRHQDASAIWKLELQRRGVPHFHLIVFGVGYLSRHWLAYSWQQIVDPNDYDLYRAGTQVQRARSWGHVSAYLEKYIAKKDKVCLLHPLGRYWGVLSRESLRTCVVARPITRAEYLYLRRVYSRYLSTKIGRRPNLYGEAGLWVKLPFPDLTRLFALTLTSGAPTV